MLIKFAVKDFLDDWKLKNVSPYTLSGYERTLNEFHGFCIENEVIDTSEVMHSLVKRYFVNCQSERGNNPATRNHKRINLRAFFNYLEPELELYDEKDTPIRKISRAKTEVKIDVFTLQRLLRHADLSMTQRDLAIWGSALKEQNDKFNPLNNITL